MQPRTEYLIARIYLSHGSNPSPMNIGPCHRRLQRNTNRHIWPSRHGRPPASRRTCGQHISAISQATRPGISGSLLRPGLSEFVYTHTMSISAPLCSTQTSIAATAFLIMPSSEPRLKRGMFSHCPKPEANTYNRARNQCPELSYHALLISSRHPRSPCINFRLILFVLFPAV